MSWVHESLAEFGRRLGLDDFSTGPFGVAQLRLASGGLLAVEPVRRGMVDEVLIYVGRPLGFEADALCRRALEKAHFSHGGPYPVQVAARGDGAQAVLLILTRLPERAFTVQTLGHAVDYLERWFDELRNGR